MGLSFRGEFNQKVDGKGRMSIPADFRRVLEEGDPQFPAKPARVVVLFGPHLKGCLHAYSVTAMKEIENGILAMKRGTPERELASRMILTKSWETEIDRDGRIVLPKERREQIGLEGESTMASMGDHFEIWNRATYEEIAEAKLKALLAEQGGDFDPLSLLPG